MRWYLALYDEAGDAMYPMLGLTAEYFAASGAGGFDLEQVFSETLVAAAALDAIRLGAISFDPIKQLVMIRLPTLIRRP